MDLGQTPCVPALGARGPLRHSALALAAAVALGLACGCGYSTRTKLPENAKSIAVPMFGNKSYHDDYTRRLEVEVTEAVRKTFLENGQLRVAGREQADLILEGDILKLDRIPLRTDRLGEPAETQVKIIVKLSLYDVRAAKYLFQDVTTSNEAGKSESGVYNLRRGEYEALGRQRAVEDLGRNIARRVLDFW